MSSAPRVSVIVATYNRDMMIGEAIKSVLEQKMTDFELLVVDDGSTDRTVEVVESIRDPRLRLIRHERNRGIPSARNSGLEAASGQYIAWLDSDDLARPDRLGVQADFLDRNPAIAMVGSRAGSIRANGRRSWRSGSKPARHEQIAAMLLFRSAMLQSSIMGRSDLLKLYPYRLDFLVAQDLDMFIRFTRDHRVANLPRTLVDRLFHSGQVVHRRKDQIIERKRVLFRESLGRLGLDPSDQELDRHIVLGRIKDASIGRDFLDWSRHWLERIVAANRLSRMYDPSGLDYAVRRVWRRASLAALRGPDRIYGLTSLFTVPRG